MKKITLAIDENSVIMHQKGNRTTVDTILITSDEVLALLPEQLHTEGMVMKVMEACRIAAERMEARHPLNGKPKDYLGGTALKEALLTEIALLNWNVRIKNALHIDSVGPHYKYTYEILVYKDQEPHHGIGQASWNTIGLFFQANPIAPEVIEKLKTQLKLRNEDTLNVIPDLEEKEEFKKMRSMVTDETLEDLKKIPFNSLLHEYRWKLDLPHDHDVLDITRSMKRVIMNYLQEEMVKFINSTM